MFIYNGVALRLCNYVNSKVKCVYYLHKKTAEAAFCVTFHKKEMAMMDNTWSVFT